MEEEPIFYIEHDGQKVKLEIPAGGMLGLLAYGDIGLRAWRRTRQIEIDALNANEDNDEE